MTLLSYIPQKNTSQIFTISLVALVLGHSMINAFLPNVALNFAGLLVTSAFIYLTTLKKNDFFSFIMVLYFCSHLPYLGAKGGGFNLVIFVCFILYFLEKSKFPFENKYKDSWFKLFVFLLVISSIAGWATNYTGKGMDFIYSILSFFGVVFLLLMSSRLEITKERVVVFLKLNFIIIIYSTIISINKYLNIIRIESPMMPTFGEKFEYFEGGGIIGSSPLYGEHSLILLILFATFLILTKRQEIERRIILTLGVIISYINIFMSISRSVFLLSILGLSFIYLFQFKIVQKNLTKLVQPVIIILIISSIVFLIVKNTKLDFVLERVENFEESTREEGGITLERILDGSAFNRGTAFAIAKERYYSRENWIIGYGWGVGDNNRDAFYVDPTIERGSAHSQIYATLFIFGWIGFIAYWGLLVRLLIKIYRVTGYKNRDYILRTFAYFFLIAFFLFVLNEVKVDSVSSPSYFAVTIIWMGLAYSTISSLQKNIRPFQAMT